MQNKCMSAEGSESRAQGKFCQTIQGFENCCDSEV